MHSIKKLEKLPAKHERIETLDVLRQLNKSSTALGELKGIAKTIPNPSMLIIAVVLQEAKDSSEIENIITTQDELYKALTASINQPSQVIEVINYRKAIFLGVDIISTHGLLRQKDIVQLQKTINRNVKKKLSPTRCIAHGKLAVI